MGIQPGEAVVRVKTDMTLKIQHWSAALSANAILIHIHAGN